MYIAASRFCRVGREGDSRARVILRSDAHMLRTGGGEFECEWMIGERTIIKSKRVDCEGSIRLAIWMMSQKRELYCDFQWLHAR